jgi:hypothetical protein
MDDRRDRRPSLLTRDDPAPHRPTSPPHTARDCTFGYVSCLSSVHSLDDDDNDLARPATMSALRCDPAPQRLTSPPYTARYCTSGRVSCLSCVRCLDDDDDDDTVSSWRPSLHLGAREVCCTRRETVRLVIFLRRQYALPGRQRRPRPC